MSLSQLTLNQSTTAGYNISPLETDNPTTYVGHSVKHKDESELSDEDIKLCESILANFQSLKERMPQAESGDTPVYYPSQAPNCILKMCSHSRYKSQASERIEKMVYARQLCKDQHFTHLLVPKVSISQDKSVLFEERINFNPDLIEQERLAAVYSQAEAIRQFTKFVLLTGMWDLRIEKQYQGPHDWARFDNFPLIEKTDGNETTLQIALIDLERISTTIKKIHFQLLPELVYVFPRSFELIMNEAKANGLTDNDKEKISRALEEAQKKGWARSDYFHGSVVLYCEKKKINLAGIGRFTPEIKQQIINQIAQEKSIKPQNIRLLESCVESFFEVLAKYVNKTNSPSVFGERSIIINTRVFDKTEDLLIELSKAEGTKLSDINRIDLYDFFKIAVENNIVHSIFDKGFILFIIA